jgi:hypothetical protein
MLRLRFRQYKDTPDIVSETTERRDGITGLQIQHRWCVGLALVAGILGLVAISLGFATLGICVYVAATLPFAFFS